MTNQLHKKISYEERKRIEKLLCMGYSVARIAETLGKSKVSIYSEISRCKSCEQYSAEYAQQHRNSRKKSQSRKPILKLDTKLAQHISDLITHEGLSPEKIIERLSTENYSDIPTSKSTIYSAIDAGLIPSVTRETLKSNRKKTRIFSKNLVRIPAWICAELCLKNGDALDIDLVDEKIIIKKGDSTL